MNRQQILDYYSRKDITNELITNAKGREVAGAFFEGSYESRPNLIQFPNDIVQMVRKGVTSFHYSVERWKNPMAIAAGNYDRLRSGWDIIFDLDSKIGMDGSRIAAEALCDFFSRYDIKNFGIKFSGSRGFHLCLPWEMFPHDEELVKRYPEIPQSVTEFVKSRINKDLVDSIGRLVKEKGVKLNEFESLSNLSDIFRIKTSFEEIAQEEKIREAEKKFTGKQVEIEKWGSRHMFRAPYSLNEKTWLVSLPINRSQLRDFSVETAKPDVVKVKEAFFKGEENEAESLLIDAMDWSSMQKKEKPKPAPKKIYSKDKMPVESFPPCIKTVLAGLADGRKRSLFTLINFLRMMNWPWQEVEQTVIEWNERNKPPLPGSTVLAQLRWCQVNKRTPANCPPDGEMYYVSTGICNPDAICKAGTGSIVIKNPIVYPFKKMRVKRDKPEEKKYQRGYSCSQCKKEFQSMNSLNIHLSRSHGISDSA